MLCSVITLCILLGVNTMTSSSVQGITITSRAQWHAKSPTAVTKIPTNYMPVPLVIIQHSTSDTHCTGTQCANAVRSYQEKYMAMLWYDIAYNFLVAPTGEIFEGRGWGVEGAHTMSYNRKSMGICVIGNYTDEAPTAKALQSLKDLIQYGVDAKQIKNSYTLLVQCQLWTTLSHPKKLFDIIKTWPHWKNVSHLKYNTAQL